MFSVLQQEGLIGMAKAAKLLPGRGAATAHPTAIVRWVTLGGLDRAGQRVRLEAVKIGRAWMTSKPALDRYFASLSADLEAAPARAAGEPRSPTQRQLASDRAGQQLELMGV